ncbi:MAG: glycosyltransferase [Betaproteobacteria bacterium]|nr:glycosyltransferase [Betaproteobacteria bacterium]
MNGATNTEPLVSVIVPTYNRAYCLGRTIQSVLDQTYRNWELIIVDNQSTDSTETLIADYNEQKIRLLKINNGGIIAASRNKGLQSARGKYVAFLDSDDWWTPDKLAESVKRLEMGADIVYHELYMISTLPPKPRFWKVSIARDLKTPAFNDLIMHGHAINTSSVVVNRDLMNKIGGFSEDPTLLAIEDYDAWLRLAKHTEAFARLGKPLGYYWDGGGNVSSTERTIRNLERLAELYRDETTGESIFANSPGYAYALGKSKFDVNKLDEAETNFKKAISKNASRRTAIRALVLLCACRLKTAHIQH